MTVPGRELELRHRPRDRELAAPCGAFAESFASSCWSSPRSAPTSGARSWWRPRSYSASTPRDVRPEGDRGGQAPQHDPGGPVVQRRGRRVRDRPGTGAGDPVADGQRVPDHRQRGHGRPAPIARNAELEPDAKPVEVTSPETAATVRDLMIGVVDEGTGVAAALPGVQVAGKTGTAELGTPHLRATRRPSRSWTPGSRRSPPRTTRRSRWL